MQPSAKAPERSTPLMIRFLLIWFVVALVVALILGRLIRGNRP